MVLVEGTHSVVDSDDLNAIWSVIPSLQRLAEIRQSLLGVQEALHEVARLQAQTAEAYWAHRCKAAFTAVELTPTPSMGRDFIKHVVESAENGATKEQVWEELIVHYDADGCARMASVTDLLSQNPVFEGRSVTLEQTLQAHRAGLDAIAVFPLIAMVEGVLLPFADEVVPNRERGFRHLPEALWQAADTNLVEPAAVSCLIAFLTKHFFAEWRPGQEADPTDADLTTLNRHRHYHGGARRGTRLSTIRCLLALEVLGVVLGEMWGEGETE